jgi:crotonobetaine/carnitine-CoA ligase
VTSSPTGPRSPEPPAATTTLSDLFVRATSESPTGEFLRTRKESLSFADVDGWSAALAGGLHDAGVRIGDRVVVAAPNRAETVAIWIACLRLGACFAPVNPEVPAQHMGTLLRSLRPSVVVAAPSYADELALAARAAAIEAVHVTFDQPSWEALQRGPAHGGWVETGAGEWAAVMCTSGTTGPSKAIALSHRWFTKICETSADYWGFSPSDRFYCPLPLYHMDGLALTVVPAIYHRTAALIGEHFSVRRFWSEVREFEATVFDFLGSTLTLLWKQPPAPDDADNPARLGWGVPLPTFQAQFEQRFGCALVDCYGSTDVGIPVYGRVGESKPLGSCGRAVDGYEVAILDEDGRTVGPDVVGEIGVRPTEPHVILEEYVGAPEATVEAWRGLWHHTGDLGRLDAEGYLYFEGRSSDSIRRRGENISAQELEAIVLAHELVVDAAAVGVPSELTEEDVKLVATVRDGAGLSARSLAGWAAEHLPRFMTVRYVEVVDDLPRTQTGKVAKGELRAGWRTPSTWDAEQQRFLDPHSERA